MIIQIEHRVEWSAKQDIFILTLKIEDAILIPSVLVISDERSVVISTEGCLARA